MGKREVLPVSLFLRIGRVGEISTAGENILVRLVAFRREFAALIELILVIVQVRQQRQLGNKYRKD